MKSGHYLRFELARGAEKTNYYIPPKREVEDLPMLLKIPLNLPEFSLMTSDYWHS